MSREKKKVLDFTTKCLLIVGISLPLLLLAALLSTHGALDTVRFYGSIQSMFSAVFLGGVITLLASAGAHRYRRNRLLRGISLVMALVSIILSLAVVSFVYIPQLSRSGDVPPQLILTGSNGDTPAIALVFYTEQASTNTVVVNGGNVTMTMTESRASNQHWFNLNLEPDTNYTYSINGQPPVQFKTPALDKLRFAASGDSHAGGAAGENNSPLTLLLSPSGVGNSREDLTARMYGFMKSDHYDLIFNLGDATQYGFSDAMWKRAFSLAAPTTASIPIEYVVGNHDSMFGGLGLYETYLCQNGQNESACLMKHIRDGNIDIIILDLEWGVQLYTPEAQQWLERELSSVPQDHWLIVMSHTFYYASGTYEEGWAYYDNPDTINALVPLFEKYHVDLVLSGHQHDLEVLKKNGVTYVIAGGFGGGLALERTYTSPASVW